MTARTEVESIEEVVEEVITRVGTGCGKMRSKIAWESRKSREPW
jgi:uncharacterized protein YheU (UPF0270 family)